MQRRHAIIRRRPLTPLQFIGSFGGFPIAIASNSWYQYRYPTISFSWGQKTSIPLSCDPKQFIPTSRVIAFKQESLRILMQDVQDEKRAPTRNRARPIKSFLQVLQLPINFLSCNSSSRIHGRPCSTILPCGVTWLPAQPGLPRST